MNIVFATNNLHKIKEIENYIDKRVCLKSLKDIGFIKEIPETSGTILGNAIQKARFLFDETGFDCFADDSGLEIEAINNRPGVDSAHFAGPQRSHSDNINKVLSEMLGCENRKALFKTVFALCLKGEIHVFEGIIEGTITNSIHGIDGFGYDPIFRPIGFKETFAEMPFELKTKISHRAIALGKLNFWLDVNILR
jgi:XTP/dITP diphosphohydrolase